MKKPTKAEAAQIAADNAARDAGYDYYPDHRNDMLVEVSREASRRYPDNKNAMLSFVEGFVFRRAKREDYQKERKP